MKLLIICIFIASVTYSDALICGEVECPPQAIMCSLKYNIANKPRREITTVSCFNSYQRNIFTKMYETPLKEPLQPPPIVECAGYKCKPGAFNCTTITTPFLRAKPPYETTRLICRNDDGKVIEERDIKRDLTQSEAARTTPPSCEGYTCPVGSTSCSYDTTIHLDPYKKTTNVYCYNNKNKVIKNVSLDH